MHRRLFAATIACACLFFALAARAQEPQPSVAEAARLNREQKKTSPKPAVVVTDDTLKPSSADSAKPEPVSTATEHAPAATPSNVDSDSVTQSQPVSRPAPANNDESKRKQEVTQLKQQLSDQQAQVELLQRLLKLDQDAFQSKADSARDTDGKAKLEQEEQELQDKQSALIDLKAKLESLLGNDSAETKPAP